jgi:proteasome lid subunit RPN8/RPN11
MASASAGSVRGRHPQAPEIVAADRDAVWKECRRRGVQVVGDVHTHPGGFGQSEVDRANPMIPERGHLALIIPNFAREFCLPGDIGIYEFRGRDGWLDHSARGAEFFAVRRFG